MGFPRFEHLIFRQFSMIFQPFLPPQANSLKKGDNSNYSRIQVLHIGNFPAYNLPVIIKMDLMILS